MTSIEILKVALKSAKDKGVDVYMPPDNLDGFIYEFAIPNDIGEKLVVGIYKDGSGSFAWGPTIKYRGGDIEAKIYDADDTISLVVRIIGYLAYLNV